MAALSVHQEDEEAGTHRRYAEITTMSCCIPRTFIFQCPTSTNHKSMSSMRRCWEERTVLVTPLRLRPARVRRRGSSQPSTNPSVTSLFSLRLDRTLYVRLRRAYSHTTGLYCSKTCTPPTSQARISSYLAVRHLTASHTSLHPPCFGQDWSKLLSIAQHMSAKCALQALLCHWVWVLIMC